MVILRLKVLICWVGLVNALLIVVTVIRSPT